MKKYLIYGLVLAAVIGLVVYLKKKKTENQTTAVITPKNEATQDIESAGTVSSHVSLDNIETVTVTPIIKPTTVKAVG